MADDTEHIRLTLGDIERLMRQAQRCGTSVDAVAGEIAEELRSVMPELDAETAAKLVRKMAKEPGQSLRAQAKLVPGALKALAE